MGKITDWKGNEIKEGDSILLVSTKSSSILVTTEPPKDIWVIELEYTIISDCGRLLAAYGIRWNGFQRIFLEPLDSLSPENLKEGVILCIKGASDNEQDYYTEYFKR